MTGARAVTCPSCGGSIEIRAVGYTVTLACRYCGSLLDVANEDVRLITAYRRAAKNFAIMPGARGTLFDVEWEVIGALRRRSGDAVWQEFLLFNPYSGYRWLVAADGEWQFGTMLLDRPEEDGRSVSWRGQHYVLDDNAEIETVMVIGEFYWRAARGDKVQGATFANGREQLSRETSADEVTWTQLIPITAEWVSEAFTVEQRHMPRPPRPDLTEGFRKAPGVAEGDLGNMFLVALAALLLILAVQVLLSGPQVCADGRATVDVGGATTIHRIGTVEVRRPWQFVTITVDSDSFTNRWVDLDYSLVNRQTQQSVDAYGLVEFYTGTDSDGPWSEGSHQAETLFSRVPRGTYDVFVDVGAHGWPSDPVPGTVDPQNPWGHTDTVALWFRSCTGGFSWGMFWLMAALLFSVPGLIFWWRHQD
ncbi:hypothetical protein NSE01_35020 [Novosphingobium sediminis]|uniref:DUF4178 domain-containing protein n=1 Tax=Novosphingobium sediminis TaxID=707214 RepID=A0A512APP1_9SPHN|nr:DUF4178 domain-containing protein [Novosphingobium sediminis]GEO01670.1 hypothetical protein NSE01_35020 [Novosphingobium sediminis]